MDLKHVRVIVWCWNFCSKMAHGLHEQMLKKSLKFQDFFFILCLVAQRLKVQAGQESRAVCIVLLVLEVTWSLVWSGHRNVSSNP